MKREIIEITGYDMLLQILHLLSVKESEDHNIHSKITIRANKGYSKTKVQKSVYEWLKHRQREFEAGESYYEVLKIIPPKKKRKLFRVVDKKMVLLIEKTDPASVLPPTSIHIEETNKGILFLVDNGYEAISVTIEKERLFPVLRRLLSGGDN